MFGCQDKYDHSFIYFYSKNTRKIFRTQFTVLHVCLIFSGSRLVDLSIQQMAEDGCDEVCVCVYRNV